MQKPQCSSFKIATCENFQRSKKCYFTGEKVIARPPSVTGGAIYMKNILLSQRFYDD